MRVLYIIFLVFPKTETRSLKERQESEFYDDLPENILEIEELPDDDQEGLKMQSENNVNRIRSYPPKSFPRRNPRIYHQRYSAPIYRIPYESGYGYHNYSQYFVGNPTRIISGIISFLVLFYFMILMLTCCIYTSNNDAIHFQRLQENRAERERLIKNATI
ncbi:unnamed protein product [Oikopleura dioica]|uniref:Uncharacterized protein n=1 Tax=Oikopleura dioica TaxID=34765 RepID=E4WRR1_OIKDI|nr:unnamed protein product [Oikopleura dioica]